MAMYECGLCGYVYVEATEDMAWDELGDDWTCPVCGSAKSEFRLMGQAEPKPASPPVPELSDGDDYLVVASKGGDPKAPGWYHNLKANPNVEINVGPKRFSVTAKPVTPDDPEYARLWPIVNDMRGNKDRYIGYQKRTSRPIPVVRLTPA